MADTTDKWWECGQIDIAAEPFLRKMGRLFAAFTEQDSGNLSYGLEVEEPPLVPPQAEGYNTNFPPQAEGENTDFQRYFIKTAGRLDDVRPYLSHAERVELLRNAVRLQADCMHPILIPLLGSIESPEGPLLVYPWVEGELLGVSRERRTDPTSAYCRFRALSPSIIARHLMDIYDLHATLERAGWIASDFYDGCLLYDFDTKHLGVMDLDTYHRGRFRNTMGRMFGSTRFMAPEEFELGATIDERTTVFTMGRAALEFLSDGTYAADRFRGTSAQYALAIHACQQEPAKRFPSMTTFSEAWEHSLI